MIVTRAGMPSKSSIKTRNAASAATTNRICLGQPEFCGCELPADALAIGTFWRIDCGEAAIFAVPRGNGGRFLRRNFVAPVTLREVPASNRNPSQQQKARRIDGGLITSKFDLVRP